MTSKDMAVIVFRFFGVYCLIFALTFLNLAFFTLLRSQSLHRSVLPIVAVDFLPAIVLVAVAIALFVYSNQLAAKLVPAQLHDQHLSRFQAQEIQAILFSFAGIMVFVMGLSPTLTRLMELVHPSAATMSTALADSWWMLLPGLLQLTLGIVLFFQAKTISAFWSRFPSGSNDNQQNSQNTTQ